MPIHDWTRVDAGIYHDFHMAWITELRNVLNNGVLPTDYYALAEQYTSKHIPDVLTLQARVENGSDKSTALVVTQAPPRVRFTLRADDASYTGRRRSLVIRRRRGDRIVAYIEIMSPGNKDSKLKLGQFLKKITKAYEHGCHLLLVDLLPPTRRDPQGIHGVFWKVLVSRSYVAPEDKPLTLAAYSSDRVPTAYVEPVAVGDTLPDMPLFLEPEAYVPVPLEATYTAAWRGVPQRWRAVLEGEARPG